MKAIPLYLFLSLGTFSLCWADINNGGASNRQDQFNSTATEEYLKQKAALEQQKIDAYNASKDANGCYAGLAGSECRKAFLNEQNQRADLLDNAELTRKTGTRQIQAGEGQKKMGVLTVVLGVGAAALLPGPGSTMSGVMLVIQGIQMMQSGDQMIKQGKDTYDSAKKFESQAAFQSALDADALNQDPAEYCLPSQGSYKEPWCQIAAAQGLLANNAALQSYSGSGGQPSLAVPKYNGSSSSGQSTNGSNVALTTAASRFSDAVAQVPGIRDVFSKGLTGEAMGRAIAGDAGVEAFKQLQNMSPDQKAAMIDRAAALAPAILGGPVSPSDWAQYLGTSTSKATNTSDSDSGMKMIEQVTSSSGFRAAPGKDEPAALKNPLDIFGKKTNGVSKDFKRLAIDESKRNQLQMGQAVDNLFYLVEVRYSIKVEDFRDMSLMMVKEEAARQTQLLKEKKQRIANAKKEAKGKVSSVEEGPVKSTLTEASEVKM